MQLGQRISASWVKYPPAPTGCIPEIRRQAFASEDFKEGIQSFVERRKAKFAGR